VNKARLLPQIAVLAGLILLIAVFIHAALSQTSRASVVAQTAPPALVLTEHDNFTTKHIKQGQVVQIRFSNWTGMAWDRPQANGSLLVPLGSSVAQAGSGSGGSWEFVATRTGITDVVSAASPTCKTGQPCPQLFFSWHVTIVVTS
jgi:predicted secreted protein